ncbi:MATE family efflux transporter [Candidatus Foliamicus sp.]
MKARLTEGPVGRQLWDLMVPMMIGLLAIISFGLVDAWFVSRLGPLPLAAVSYTQPVGFVVAAMAMGIGVGASSVIARLLGQGAKRRVRRIATHAFLLCGLLGIVLLSLGWLFMEQIFGLLGADETTMPLVRDYMQIYLVGLVFVVGPTIGGSVLRALGDAKSPGFLLALTAVVNAILDPILIFGLFGFPRLEVQGAALATVIANIVSLTAMLVIAIRRDKLLTLRGIKLIFDSWKRILHVGLSATASGLMAPLTSAFVTAMVARFGQTAVAGFGVGIRTEALALLPMMALGAALGPFVGQNAGAERMDRVRAARNWCLRFLGIYGLTMAALLSIFAESIVGLFTDDPGATEAAVTQLRIIPWTYCLLGVTMLANTSLNALGKPLAAMIVSLCRTLLVYVPLSWLLGLWFGLPGVFFGGALGNLVSATVGFALLQRGLRQVDLTGAIPGRKRVGAAA